MTDRRSGLARFRAWLRRRGSPGRPARYPAVAATVRTFPIPADSAGEVVVAAALRDMMTEWVELLGRDRHEDALASIITEIPMASGMAEAVGAQAWTPDILRQVIAYMSETLGDAETSITREVERYCVQPGQASSYMLGWRVWTEARTRARKRLGARFDLRAFHDRGLLAGSMPLDVLAQVIDDWR